MLALLYALAMVVLLVYGLNLLWLAVRQAWSEHLLPGVPPDPEAVPEPDGTLPSVTVQLPLYNEPLVAERLIDACAALRYPRRRLEIQVLDDSTDETTALVTRRVAFWKARGLDIVHLHRRDRTGYKAGALQNGLRLAQGTCIAVFDADFMPPPDFLLRAVPPLCEPGVGLVQARWGHLNEEDSLLTRLQALGLDVHFAVEQHMRNRLGYFMNFNGTAGVWRRACIEEAGGWQSDTLTEDLDLSYRAQLQGWTFRYLPDLEVPAELPATLAALRAQQFRWTKGAAETALKLLGRLWRSAQPARIKLEGTLHLTGHVVFPFVLLAALLHAPLLVQRHLGQGPGPWYFAAMALGMFGFAGFVLAQGLAQRALYPDWPRRLGRLPLFMAGSMGIALSNTRAIVEALCGRRSPFVRTPKYDRRPGGSRRPLPGSATHRSAVVWLEAVMMLYCAAGLGVLAWIGAWSALPFQALFALGFALVTLSNLQETLQARRTRRLRPAFG